MHNPILVNSLIEALGWTIIHSLWQCTLIVLGIGVLSLIIPNRKVVARYWVLMVGLFGQFIWSVLTFCHGYSFSELALVEEEAFSKLAIEEITNVQLAGKPFFSIAWLPDYFSFVGPYLHYIAIAWIFGVALASLRMSVGWYQLYTLSREGVVTFPRAWTEQICRWQESLGIRNEVRCLISEKVKSPITFYWLKPVILIPSAIYTGFTPTQLEVLILHELAHIRRRDFLFNLLQSCIEVLFFYHPAIWWLSKRIRETREYCCDDMVIKMKKDPYLYAETLTQIPFIQFSLSKKLVMTANQKPSLLSRRIFRLFGETEQRSYRTSLPLILVLLGGLWMAFGTPVSKPPVETAFELDAITNDSLPNAQKPTTVYTGNYLGKVTADTLVTLGRFNSELRDTIPTLDIKTNLDIEEQPFKIRTIDSNLENSYSTGEDNEPLIIVDGEIMKGRLKLETLNPNDIEFISVLKGEAATGVYGAKGKNGVVEVTTKANLKKLEHIKVDETLELEKLELIEVEKSLDNKLIRLKKELAQFKIDTLGPEQQIALERELAELVEKKAELEQKSAKELKAKADQMKIKAEKMRLEAEVMQEKAEKMRSKAEAIKLEEKEFKALADQMALKAEKFKIKAEALQKEIARYEFEVFPNPASDQMAISFNLPNRAPVKIEVFSIEGKLIKQVLNEPLNSGKHKYFWNVTSANQGMYLVELTIGDRNLQKKVSVQ